MTFNYIINKSYNLWTSILRCPRVPSRLHDVRRMLIIIIYSGHILAVYFCLWHWTEFWLQGSGVHNHNHIDSRHWTLPSHWIKQLRSMLRAVGIGSCRDRSTDSRLCVVHGGLHLLVEGKRRQMRNGQQTGCLGTWCNSRSHKAFCRRQPATTRTNCS